MSCLHHIYRYVSITSMHTGNTQSISAFRFVLSRGESLQTFPVVKESILNVFCFSFGLLVGGEGTDWVGGRCFETPLEWAAAVGLIVVGILGWHHIKGCKYWHKLSYLWRGDVLNRAHQKEGMKGWGRRIWRHEGAPHHYLGSASPSLPVFLRLFAKGSQRW